jgi:hypothetical protein
MAQEAAPTQPDGQVQQMHWLAAQIREMQLANLQTQTQMQANMQAQLERLA